MSRWIKIFRLCQTLSKMNLSFFNFRYKLHQHPDTYSVILTFFVLSIAGVFYYYYFQIVENFFAGFSDFGLQNLFCQTALSAVTILLMMLSAFLLLNTFCFSKDITHLQLFPLKPCDIFTSKYLVAVLFCYGLEIFLLLPICIVHVSYLGELSVVITYFSAAVILPHTVIFPLAIIITICLKISMHLKHMRIVLPAIGILAYFAVNILKVALLNGPPGETQDLLQWCHTFLIPFPLYNEYIVLVPGLKLFCTVFAVLLTVGYYYLSGFIMGKDYFIYEREMHTGGKTIKYSLTPKWKSYFKKECKIFFRSPVYVVNGLFGIIVTPFLLPLSFRLSATAKSIEQIRRLVTTPEFSFYAMLFALAVVALTSSINVTASSSFSREGSNYWITRIIPYSIKQQAFVKILFSTSISITGILINCFLFKFYFYYKFSQIAGIALLGILFSILCNLIGTFIDMKHPKLEWTNETEAVKQNINVIICILLCIGILICYFGIISKMLRHGSGPYTIVSFLTGSLCALILLVCKGITSVQK